MPTNLMSRAWMLALCLVVVGCGDDGSPLTLDASATADASLPRQVVMEPRTLLVGEIAEATLTGGPGDSARIMVTAPVAQLDWNIHGHANGSTQTVQEEFAVMSFDYAFAPTAQAAWYLLLRNKHTEPMTVTVTIELYGNLAWSGWL